MSMRGYNNTLLENTLLKKSMIGYNNTLCYKYIMTGTATKGRGKRCRETTKVGGAGSSGISPPKKRPTKVPNRRKNVRQMSLSEWLTDDEMPLCQTSGKRVRMQKIFPELHSPSTRHSPKTQLHPIVSFQPLKQWVCWVQFNHNRSPVKYAV